MATDGKLKLELEPRTDSYGKKFYIAKLKGPVLIDCKDGVAFLVFCSEEGNEELQISSLAKGKVE